MVNFWIPILTLTNPYSISKVGEDKNKSKILVERRRESRGIYTFMNLAICQQTTSTRLRMSGQLRVRVITNGALDLSRILLSPASHLRDIFQSLPHFLTLLKRKPRVRNL